MYRFKLKTEIAALETALEAAKRKNERELAVRCEFRISQLKYILAEYTRKLEARLALPHFDPLAPPQIVLGISHRVLTDYSYLTADELQVLHEACAAAELHQFSLE
jgi:hypothetical protein